MALFEIKGFSLKTLTNVRIFHSIINITRVINISMYLSWNTLLSHRKFEKNIISYFHSLVMSRKEHYTNSFLSSIFRFSINYPIFVQIIIPLIISIFHMYSQKHQIPYLFLNNGFIMVGGLECEKENMDQGRSFSEMNIFFTNCFFSRITEYSGDGGVIFVSKSYYSMKGNSSMFHNCTCSNHGGAICFMSSNSHLLMICSNGCSCGAAYQGHFSKITASQDNQMVFISGSYCSHTTSGKYPIYTYLGNQRIDNLNSSMNNAEQISGIGIFAPSPFSSSHCSYSNNKASNGVCIYCYSSSGSMSISYANIVYNNSPFHGVVHTNGGGERKMKYCIFQNNQNNLFSVREGSLEVSHSFIDHAESSFSISIPLSTINNSMTHWMTFQIQFFNSHHCNADMPLIDTTPFQTFKKSEMGSIEESIRRTHKETFLDHTMEETLKGTIHRSYDDMRCTIQLVNKRGINVIFSFSVVSFMVVILFIS